MYYFKYLTWLMNWKNIILISFSLAYMFKRIIYRHFYQPRWLKFTKEFPGPRIYPIIGSPFTLLTAAKIGFGQLLTNYAKIYGPTFHVNMGVHLVLVVTDVNDAQAILTSSNCLDRVNIGPTFQPILGNSLPCAAPVAIWKRKRKEYYPFFKRNVLLRLIPKMNELNDKYIEKMQKEVDGPEFDVISYSNDVAFDTIMKTHLGYDFSDEERKQLNLHHRLDEAYKRASIHSLFPNSFLQAMLQWFYPVDIAGTVRVLHNFLDKVVNLIRKSPTQSSRKEVTEIETSNEETFAQSYVDTLLKLKNELNEADLVYTELTALMLGGVETTGVLMAFCLLALAAHPEIQDKAYQEIYEVLGDDKRPFEASDLNKFPYLEMVIKETMRLFTIVPVISKTFDKDTKIGSRIFPTGTAVFINIGGIHHNPNLYPEPYRFNPENFTAEAIEKRHRYSFIPFGEGARSCIAREFANIIIKLRLISFLRTFTFHTTAKLEHVRMRVGHIESSSTGYPVSIKLRRKLTQLG